jgi:hypothetical protein
MEFDDAEDTLNSSSTTSLVGELGSMCSVEEARLRMETRQVDRFEMVSSTVSDSVIQIDLNKAVKKYQRSSADKKYFASEIRTIKACNESIEFLLNTVLDFDVSPKPGFAQQCYTANFFDIYSFLRDRLRAIRVDLHLQNIVTDPVFIRTHERCLRFELLSLYLLWGRDFGTEKKFDIHMSLTSLSQTIDPLTNAYKKRRDDPTSTIKEDQIEIEAEITGYILLLSLTSRGGAKTFKAHFLKQPDVIRNHEKVVWAFNVCMDFYSNNWSHFIDRFKKCENFLAACSMLPVLNLARTRILWRMVRTNRPFFARKSGPMPPPRPESIPLSHLENVLGFKSSKECRDYLIYNGLDVVGANCLIPPRQLTRNPITWWMSSQEWREKSGDDREIPEYSWSVELDEAFHSRLGEDIGDEFPPERCDFPKKIEQVLVDKYISTTKQFIRKQIVDGSRDAVIGPPSPNRKIASSYPTFIHQELIEKPLVIEIPKIVRPIVPIEPLAVKPSIFSQSTPAFPEQDVLKRSRESVASTPSTPVDNQIPTKKLWQETEVTPVVEVPQPPMAPPLPPIVLPPLPLSGFDLLSNEFGAMEIGPFRSPKDENKPHTSMEPVSLPARLVQAEIEAGKEYMREIEVAKRRTRYIAVNCLIGWKAIVQEESKWKRILGVRPPIRL